jgi:hypothetical protein
MNKFLSFLLCIFMILCTVGCAKNQKSYEEQKALYDDIIAQYTALLRAKHNGEELTFPDTENMSAQEAAIAEALFGIVDACADEKAAEILGYGYKDVDDNGTPELILLNKHNRLRAIFTISDGAPILLEANYDMGTSFGFVSKNRILLLRRSVTDHIEEGIVYMCHVDGDKMVYDYACGKVYDQEKRETLETFRLEDGERIPIDEDTFRALNREYQKYSVPLTTDSAIYKLAAPRIICPLDSSTSDVNLPVADFSDYAAIRKTYLAISDCLEQFKRSEWEAGKYDNLFSFPDDRSFEYYSHLLYIAYVGIKNMGYDEIDLNGDGQDELVLMNGDYRIKAIFTQKDGVPVLLDAFVFPYHTCWLDDE